jgi:hypothetical protein
MKQSQSTSKKPKPSQKAERTETVNAFYRDGKTLRNWMEFLIETKQNFICRSSTYSTTITLPNGNKLKFFKNKYDNHVFIANKLILKDMRTKNNVDEIIKGDFKKINYDSKNGLANYEADNVINIDISSAYASTLANQGLISKRTFDFLQRLKKFERLPAIGMLARKSMVFTYQAGQCVDTNIDLSPNAQIFYFLIHQVEQAMQEAKNIAGDHYLFHWVDGIFIDSSMPEKDLRKIEQVFVRRNYEVKYENIEKIKIWREDDDIWVDMIKNGDKKVFSFVDRNLQKNVQALLEALAENYEKQSSLHRISSADELHGDSAHDIQRPRLNDFFDSEEWMA